MRHALAFAGVGLAFTAVAALTACGSEDLDNNGGLVDGGGTGATSGAGAGSGGKSGGAGSGGAAGKGGSGGSAGTGGIVNSSPLGSNCITDADCVEEGLICLTSFGTSTDELAGGLCTLACDPALLDADCSEAEPGALCVEFVEGENYCMEGCMLGADLGCSERSDIFCIDLSNETAPVPAPACLPFCVNDDQCSTGVCDHETGLCSTMSDPGTLLLGEACTPAPPEVDPPPPDTCAEGFCIAVTDDFSEGVCSQICRGDVLPQCGWDGPEPPASPGICLQSVDSGLLDLGLCRKTCNCDMECGNPGFVCRADSQLMSLGVAGFCVLSTDAMGMPVTGIPTCP